MPTIKGQPLKNKLYNLKKKISFQINSWISFQKIQKKFSRFFKEVKKKKKNWMFKKKSQTKQIFFSATNSFSLQIQMEFPKKKKKIPLQINL